MCYAFRIWGDCGWACSRRAGELIRPRRTQKSSRDLRFLAAEAFFSEGSAFPLWLNRNERAPHAAQWRRQSFWRQQVCVVQAHGCCGAPMVLRATHASCLDTSMSTTNACTLVSRLYKYVRRGFKLCPPAQFRHCMVRLYQNPAAPAHNAMANKMSPSRASQPPQWAQRQRR